MSSILTNQGAFVALQTMRGINADMARVQNEISTGLRVGSARDNAATWAISKVMESDVQGFRTIRESLSLGESTVAVARQASETVTSLLTQTKDKIVAAQESNVDRDKIQADIAELRAQIGSVVNAAQFNGLNMVNNDDVVNILSSLDRSADGTVATRNISVTGQNLSFAAAQAGTTASDDLLATASIAGLSAGDTGNLATAATQDFEITGAAPEGTDTTVTFEISGTAPDEAGGTETSFTVNGIVIDVTLGQDAGDEAMATAIQAAFNEVRDDGTPEEQAALEGITVERTGAALAFTSSGMMTEVEIDFSEIDENVTGVDALTGAENVATLAVSGVETEVTITINDVDLELTLANGADADAIAGAIAAAVAASDDEALANVTVEADGATVTVTNASGDDVTADLSAIHALAGATVGGDGVEDGEATIESNAATITFASDDMTLAGGDVFQVTLGEGDDAQVFSYTLTSTAPNTAEGRAAAFAEIADGLAAEITAATGLSASAADGVLSVSNTGEDALSFEVAAFTGGSSEGRLAALADINVSTEDGARDALDAIEGLIQTAIDASAAFGSAQGRIETQTDFVSKLTDSLRAGIGTLVDADMEETSARLQALQVQQQLAIQSLSIANQAPQNILALFR